MCMIMSRRPASLLVDRHLEFTIQVNVYLRISNYNNCHSIIHILFRLFALAIVRQWAFQLFRTFV